MTAFRSIRATAAGPLLAMAILCATGFTQDYVRRLSAGEIIFIPAPAEFMGISIDPRIVRRLLGVRLVFADLIWIDTLIKSDTLHEQEPFSRVYRAFHTVVILDPDNLLVYYIAGSYLSIVKDDIKGASAILREGVQYMDTHSNSWSGAWRIPFTLGYNLIFEERDIDEGSKWIQRAAQFPNAPQMVLTLAKHVATEAGRLEIGSRVLNEMYRSATRIEDKKRIEAKMMDFSERQELYELNEKFQTFIISTKSNAFSKKKQFQFFMRSLGHSGKDMLGRKLGINDGGKVVAFPENHRD